MGKWQIKDPNTGQAYVVEGNTPPTQQDAAGIFQQYQSSKKQPSQDLQQNPIVDFLTGGLKPAEKIAQDVGAGIGMNIQGPGLQQSQEGAMQQAQAAYQKAMQTQDPAEKARLLKVAQDTYQTVGQTAQGISSSFSSDIQKNPVSRGIVGSLGTIGTYYGMKGLPELVTGGANAITKGSVGKLAPWLTKTGVAGKIDVGAAKGADAVWNDFHDFIIKGVQKEWEKVPGKYSKTAEKILNEFDPGTELQSQRGGNFILENNPMTSTALRGMKQKLGNRLPQSFWDNALHGGSFENQVTKKVRDLTAEYFHKVAPESALPDRIYSLYSKIGGDVPGLLKKIAVMKAADIGQSALGLKSLEGPLAPVIDLLIGSRF